MAAITKATVESHFSNFETAVTDGDYAAARKYLLLADVACRLLPNTAAAQWRGVIYTAFQQLDQIERASSTYRPRRLRFDRRL